MPALTEMAIDLKNKKVTVIGLARSGVAVCGIVKKLGGFARVSDQKTRKDVEHEHPQWISDTEIIYELGGHTREFIQDSDLVVLSPGVRRDALPVLWAMAQNIPVMAEIEFAYRFCPAPIIAVTGSNGKTTTVTLIAEILKKSGRNVFLCGNIGRPFSQCVLEIKPDDWVVLEVSSFQLEMISSFKPRVALILNFSENHLDRHKDIQEYFDAKRRIHLNQDGADYAVLNFEQPALKSLASSLKAQVSFYNSPEKVAQQSNPNYLAAMEVARVLGINLEIANDVFRQFKGVEHRLEWVRTIKDVDYINDSKATTVEAGRWALERIQKPVVMICGGRDKNLDFSLLRDLVQTKVKTMVVYGEAREKLRNAFADIVPVASVKTLPDAVNAAYQIAHTGQCVVLSPMCTSYDFFANFEERGRVFKELVRALPG